MPTCNPIVDREGLVYASARAFFPWVGVADLANEIPNIFIIMSATFNAYV